VLLTGCHFRGPLMQLRGTLAGKLRALNSDQSASGRSLAAV
jgi:hypothetical protein